MKTCSKKNSRFQLKTNSTQMSRRRHSGPKLKHDQELVPMKIHKPSFDSTSNKDDTPKNLVKPLSEFDDNFWLSSSQESFVQSVVPEERARDLACQANNLKDIVENYEIYLRNIEKDSNKGLEILKNKFETEFSKLNSANASIQLTIKNYLKNISNSFLANTLKQQQILTNENKEIKLRLSNLSHLRIEIIKTAEIAKKFENEEENKSTTEDQSEFKLGKARFFELESDFEKSIKFKPKEILEIQNAELNIKNAISQCSTILTLHDNSFEICEHNISPELLTICQKMKEIKRPVLTLFQNSKSDKNPEILVTKFTSTLSKISTEKILNPTSVALDSAQILTHPNGRSIFIVSDGFIVQYDSQNNVFLKKPINLACAGTIGASVTLFEHYIYLFGGFKAGKAQSCAFRFNIISEKWTSLAPMQIERYNSFACSINNDKICVIGGENETNSVLGNIEIFDVRSNIWEICSISLKIPRKSLSAISTEQDKILIFGGISSEKEFCSDIEEIDISQNKNRIISSQTNPRRNAQIFSIGQKIYLLGGYPKIYNETFGEIFKPENNTWELIEKINCEKTVMGILYE